MTSERRDQLLGFCIGLAYEGISAGLALQTGYDAIWSRYLFVTPGILALTAFLGFMAARGGSPRIASIALGAAAAALTVLVVGALPAILAD
jgi:hypothetical protein